MHLPPPKLQTWLRAWWERMF